MESSKERGIEKRGKGTSQEWWTKKIKERIKIKTYFMDKIASLQLYPDELEMTSGGPVIRL